MLAALLDQRGGARAISATEMKLTASLRVFQVQGEPVLGLKYLMQVGALAAGHALGRRF